jgi:hypothetical protein
MERELSATLFLFSRLWSLPFWPFLFLSSLLQHSPDRALPTTPPSLSLTVPCPTSHPLHQFVAGLTTAENWANEPRT